ncbi:MAG: tryptophan 7-halogenase [Proteobacteria bacterium]|nr:tryptophan 7-halogenase [Pseudomonadota bacterium]
MVGDAVDLDVAIIGGGLAGNLLARQLRRSAPELSVGVFEKSTERSFKVGEATVEIQASYLIRRQGLTQYLYESHLPKNGLRYFFDDCDRSLQIHRMGEMGTDGLPLHPSFQLDRARFEADLLDMNRRDGVRVREGVQVTGIELGAGGEPHRFRVRGGSGGTTTSHSCRWLVDASGRAGLVAGIADLRVREEIHRVGSVWGRFENVADIDEAGTEEWRAAVRHTSRRLSTNHFWYPGYWIWMIPLRGGLISMGVTGKRVAQKKGLRTPEGFRAFLDEHRAIRDLLADAKMVDVSSYSQIAYGTRRFFHPDRWGLTGEAATSLDPFYSPGGDFIALENDFLVDLIRRDFAGEDRAALAEQCDLYDRFMKFRHEATLLLFRNLYDCMGSMELARVKWDFDIGCYYNLWVHSYMRDEHLNPSWLRRQLRLEELVLQSLRNFSDLFQQCEAALRTRGEYFRENEGCFYHGLNHIDFVEEVGQPRTRKEVFRRQAKIFNSVRNQLLSILDRESGECHEELPLTTFLLDRPLA